MSGVPAVHIVSGGTPVLLTTKKCAFIATHNETFLFHLLLVRRYNVGVLWDVNVSLQDVNVSLPRRAETVVSGETLQRPCVLKGVYT